MSPRILSIPCSVLLTLSLLPTAVAAAEAPAPGTPVAAFVPRQVIVEWDTEASRSDRVGAREAAGVSYQADLGDPAFQLVEVEAGQTAAGAIEELRSDPAVAVAERDGYSAPTSLPDDPLLAQEWGLENLGGGVAGFSGAVAGADIDAPGAWEQTVGDPATLVADVDSGYRFDSPDLGPVAWENPDEIDANGSDDDGNGYADDIHGYDFVGPDSEAPGQDADPTDDDLISGGHGVHTAGTIGAAGDNGVGITGVAQNVRIMPLRVCANAPSLNQLRCPNSSIIAAINYAGDNGARAANISLSGTVMSTAMLDALAENPQTLFVTSAGNDSEDNDSEGHYPCDYAPASTSIDGAVENVVCVAATDQADELASFSDWGADTVDLGAPGTEILSTYPAMEAPLDEGFEQDDFEARWDATGADGGFERTDEAPLTSFGISDSPGAAPVAGSGHSSTLASPVAVPAGSGSCRLSGRDFVALDGGSFTLFVFRDGLVAYTFQIPSTEGSQMASFVTTPMTGLAGSDVRVRVRYIAGPSPSAASGAWLDDLELRCYAPLSTAPGYEYLEGTSMAAPHVTGAAALLFSSQPGASVAAVRHALLASVDPNPSLAGITTAGGRLDGAAALADLSADAPAAPALSGTDPASPANENEPRLLGSAEAGSTVQVYSGGACAGEALASGSAAALAAGEIAVTVADDAEGIFSARASDPWSNLSACSAPVSYVEDSTAPAAPLLESTSPPSPAANSSPRILGSAESGSSVAIYAGDSCQGAPLETGSAAALSAPGIAVTVLPAAASRFSAKATDAADNASPCSTPISYTNSTTIGSGYIPGIDLNPRSTPIEPPPAIPSCTVPKLAGKTLAQAKAALGGAGCRVGKVTKPKVRVGQKPPALVVRSTAPAAGSAAAGAVVALTLAAKPKRHRH